MADNMKYTESPAGTTIASDDVGGVQFQRVKIAVGADGRFDGDVSAAQGLPVVSAALYAKQEEAAMLIMLAAQNEMVRMDSSLQGSGIGQMSGMSARNFVEIR